MTSTQAWRRPVTGSDKLASLKGWLYAQRQRQRSGRRTVVTADEIVAYIKKRWPRTRPEEIEWLYQQSE